MGFILFIIIICDFRIYVENIFIKLVKDVELVGMFFILENIIEFKVIFINLVIFNGDKCRLNYLNKRNRCKIFI